MTVAVSDDQTGKDQTTLTIGYTTTQGWLGTSWIVLTVPKANLVYETDNPGFAK